MKQTILLYSAVLLTINMIGAGLVSPPLSPVPGTGGGGGPTNGQTAAQVATQINNSNSTVFANTYIAASGGSGSGNTFTGASLGANTAFLSVAGGDILYTDDTGFVAGVPNVAGVLTNSAGTPVHYGFSTIPKISLAGTTANTLPLASINTNGGVLGQIPTIGSDAVVHWSNAPSGGGTSIPSVLGVVTNTAGGVVGVSTAVPGTWLAPASIPITAADTSWMSITNAVAVTNQPLTAGQALVVIGTNSYGATMVKGTNWPTGGGGSQTPWTSDIIAAKFNLYDVTDIRFTNNIASKPTLTFDLEPTVYGATLGAIFGGTNSTTATTALEADYFIADAGSINRGTLTVTNTANAGVTTILSNTVTTGTLTANGGTVSLIPTNASPVLTAANVTGSLPMGITNTLSGRAQPVFQGYAIDAVGGTPILTVSNETTGVKLTFSRGASASITPETNWWTLPITTTNTIWRVRDESSGTGASVGVTTNWLIGL